MTIEQLKEKLHEIDLILRPQILFVNPNEYNQIVETIPDLSRYIKIVSTNAVEVGYAVLMDRKRIEEYDSCLR